ncbi:MAG: hypothetical protein CMJ46_14530 [Planctomyces sp.]|nr:hypothetical protein [Planctomyces sp.]
MPKLITLVAIVCGFLLSSNPASADEPPERYRFLFHCDGETLFQLPAPPVKYGYIEKSMDEIASTGATTLVVSTHIGMVPIYPSEHSNQMGEKVQSNDRSRFKRDGTRLFGTLQRSGLNIEVLIKDGIDPLQWILTAARHRELETFLSFGLNNAQYGNDPFRYPNVLAISQYWREHRDLRLGTAGAPLPEILQEILGPSGRRHFAPALPVGLDFAKAEVRDRRLLEIDEILNRYDIDGLEINFHRYPMFFKPDEVADNLETMTGFMQEVRKRVDAAGQKHGHPIKLVGRVMPRPEYSKAIGLDVERWAREGLLDFIIVSHCGDNEFTLPIREYRQILPDGYPVYASIAFESKGEDYREIAAQLRDEQPDGIHLQNFHDTLDLRRRPDYKLAEEMGTVYKDVTSAPADPPTSDQGDNN